MPSATSRPDRVRAAYSAAAEFPSRRHPFPVGRAFAASLGYPKSVLRRMPAEAVDAFSGVSNLGHWAEVDLGWTIVDLGCGAGLDTLLTAERTGAAGFAIGIDFSAPMLGRARRAAIRSGLPNATFVQASASRLPLGDESVDAVLANGIFNLNTDRSGIFAELARVIKKGGRVWAAELTLIKPLPEAEREDESNWFA